MYARTIQAALVPGRADDAISTYEEQVLPLLQQQPGYVRSTMLIDRDKNEAMTITIWESKEAAGATGEGTAYLKRAVGLLAGMVVPKSYRHWEIGLTDRQTD